MEELKQFLLANNGKPNEYSWYELALKFNITQDKEFESECQKRKALGDKVRIIWSRLSNSKPSPPYEGLKLKSVWEQRTKDGTVHVLHSYTNETSPEQFINDVESVIKDSLSNIEPIFLPKLPTNNSKALFLPIADMHIGAIGGSFISKNEYNKEVIKSRILKILENLYYQSLTYGKFDQIIISDLGDSLDGYNKSTVRGGKELDQNLNNREQFDTYFNVFKYLFDSIVNLNICNSISYYGVQGNHSGSFEYTAQKAIQIYLDTKYPDIKTKVTSDFITTIKYGNHLYHITHGKDEKYMKHGLPIILNDKTEIMLQRYIDENNYGPSYYHTLVKGDLHQHVDQRDYKFRYLSCPSFFGGTEFIHFNYGLSKPSVIFDIIDKKEKNIIKGEILFTNER